MEQNANAILHVDVKGSECLEGANLLCIFTLIPLVHISASVLLPRLGGSWAVEGEGGSTQQP